jgi:hypothetical protein
VASVGLVVNNYLALTLPYWVLLSGVGLAWVARSLTDAIRADWARPALLGLASVFALVLLADATTDARELARSSTRSYEPIRATSVELGEEYDHRCIAVTSYAPQVGYYSGCLVNVFGTDLAQPLTEMLPQLLAPYRERIERDGLQVSIFVVNDGKRQPPPEAFTPPAIDEERRFLHSVGDGRRQTSWVHLVEPCALDATC